MAVVQCGAFVRPPRASLDASSALVSREVDEENGARLQTPLVPVEPSNRETSL
jgi:hypothetical protein